MHGIIIGTSERMMREFLEGGKQMICEDISKLSYLVDVAMESRGKQGERCYKFAKGFTTGRFEEGWRKLIEDLEVQKSIN